jgi:hypothetical protein
MRASLGCVGDFNGRRFFDDTLRRRGNSTIDCLAVGNFDLRRTRRIGISGLLSGTGGVSSGRHPILYRLFCVRVRISRTNPTRTNLAEPFFSFSVVSDSVDFELKRNRW